MHAIALAGSLKRSPDPSNTEGLTQVVLDELERLGASTELVRLVDHTIEPGVVTEKVTDADEWPGIHDRVLAADIVIFATPTWLGQPSSVIKGALERLDATISETDDRGRPVLYDKVAGFVVVGNEDGAHHVIAELAQAAIDLGLTVPGNGWTYWNKGPGPGEEEYLTSDEQGWSDQTGRTAARNLFTVARALKEHPLPRPATE
jgi:multimeric flavodoxin WrbA